MKITIHHDFVQSGKQHSRYKANLPSIVLSQLCCEVYFIPLTVVNTQRDLATTYYWNCPSNLTGWIRPWATRTEKRPRDRPRTRRAGRSI